MTPTKTVVIDNPPQAMLAEQAVMSKTDTRRYNRFVELTQTMQTSKGEIVKGMARYWSAMYEIYDKNYWDVSFDSQEAWIGDLVVQDFGPSRSQFFQVMAAFDAMLQNGVPEPKAIAAMASGHSAIIHDLPKWFNRTGKRQYELKPDQARRLAEDGESLAQAIERIQALSPTDARNEVTRRDRVRHVAITDASWKGPRTVLVQLTEKGGGKKQVIHDVAVRLPEEPTDLLIDWANRTFKVSGE